MNFHEITQKLPPFRGRILIGSSFLGTAPKENLAASICKQLEINPIQANLGLFKNGECRIEISETLTGEEIFFLQTLGLPEHNRHLVESAIIGDYLRDTRAAKSVGVFPHCSYTRQDRPDKPGVPVSAKTVARILGSSFDQLIFMGLHFPQFVGFFDQRPDHLYARPLFVPVITRLLEEELMGERVILASTDTGGSSRVKSIGAKTGLDVAIVDKDRIRPGEANHGGVIGEDKVPGAVVVVFDDMVDSGNSLDVLVKAMVERGAKCVYVFADHGINSGNAIQIISRNDHIKRVYYTDSIPPKPEVVNCGKIVYIPAHELFAAAIWLTYCKRSLACLFSGFERIG